MANQIVNQTILRSLRQTGILLVVTGISGAGKDAVVDALIAILTTFRRLVTCTDRSAREGEIHGVHYYFLSPEELDHMYELDELVEKPLVYGTSRKATPKREFRKVLEGDNLIWRIDPTLAAHVANGAFFDEQFSPEESAALKAAAVVVFITASPDELATRRQKRDGNKYDPTEYVARDQQDQEFMATHGDKFTVVLQNRDGRLAETVQAVVDLVCN